MDWASETRNGIFWGAFLQSLQKQQLLIQIEPSYKPLKTHKKKKTLYDSAYILILWGSSLILGCPVPDADHVDKSLHSPEI